MADSTVCLTYDFDAVSAWTSYGMPGFHSWGRFGAEVAAPRLLDLHDRFDVPGTWFVPGHTAESFPEAVGDVWDRGYEIQHHGWSHRSPASFETRAAERRDLERGIDALEAVTGERPVGYRAPDGGFSQHTVSLLEELGFEWDSSDSARDFEPYRLRKDWDAPVDEPYDPGEPTNIVEIPTVWHRDDWMQLFPVVSGPEWVAYAQEESVFARWRAEFQWMHGNVDGGVYVLLLHPQCAGRAPFLARLESFIESLVGRSNVRFAAAGTVAAEYAD